MHRQLSRLVGQHRAGLLRSASSSSSQSPHPNSSNSAAADAAGFDTSFGFERVPRESKQAKVNAVFNRVSDSYDLMNDLMSLGLHRCWKRRFVRSANPRPGWSVLDVAGGTGDIALSLIRWADRFSAPGAAVHHTTAQGSSSSSEIGSSDVDQFRRQAERQLAQAESEPCRVVVVDPSESMMRVGQAKAAAAEGVGDARIDWKVGRAESLPLGDASVQLYTIAFGMRNCTDLPAVLTEAYRVLKPYGRFACLEFCTLENPLLSMLYDEYSFRVIPPLGQLVAGDWDSYEYLVQSIRRFPHQDAFAGMMGKAGFSGVSYEILPPGVCCIHSGFKLS